MTEKRVFAGSNTAKGFHSCFEFVFNPEELNRLYILKGGPGVGKNQFMKKFVSKMKEKNYTFEYVHCSSDPESLDGIIIPELKIAFVDGTAPHAIDPKIPGAVDEIVNLGEFLDHEKLEKHKHQIMRINNNKSLLYKSAYRYLRAAGVISEEISSLYDQFINIDKFEKMCTTAINKLFPENIKLNKKSKIKKMFLESYTADGYKSHEKALCQNKKVWAVIGESTNYTSKFLNSIVDEATKRGYDIELYLMPLNPEKIQHIYIPEMNLVILSSEIYLTNGFEEVFDIHGIMDTDNLRSHISEIENNLHLFELLIKNALEKLSETKKYHELLEVFYINSMDFDGVNKYFDSIINRYT